MSRELSVALAKLRWSADPDRDLERSIALAAAGFAGGADVVIAPADEECLYLVKVDLNEVAGAGRRTSLINPAQDRRRDMYSVTYLGQSR
jgi:hypothetical protein